MEGNAQAMKDKPLFSSDQIVNVTDLQRKWRKTVEPKLKTMPFLMLFSGSEPKAAILDYEEFERFWKKANEASELRLELELLYRILENEKTGEPLVPLVEVVSKTNITAEDLEAAPDVELEAE